MSWFVGDDPLHLGEAGRAGLRVARCHRPEEFQRDRASFESHANRAKVRRQDVHADLFEQFARRGLCPRLAGFDLSARPFPVAAKGGRRQPLCDQPFQAPGGATTGDRDSSNGGRHEPRLSDMAEKMGPMRKNTWKINEIGARRPIDETSMS